MEIREISGFPKYRADSDGFIWSEKGRSFRRLKIAVGTNGYLKVHLRKDDRYHSRYVHRLVLEAFIGPCPKGMECRHLNGDKTDNRLENLVWGTKEENEKDKISHGTHQFGERNPNRLLSAEEVELVREASESEETQQSIARRFGVSQSCIAKIANGRTWGH